MTHQRSRSVYTSQAARQQQFASSLARFPFAAALLQLGANAIEIGALRHDGTGPAPILQHPLMGEANLRAGIGGRRRQQPRIDERSDKLVRRLVALRRNLRKRHRANRQRAIADAVLLMSRHRKLPQEARECHLLRIAQ